MGENQTYSFEFSEYRLDPVERRLLRNGKVIPLTPKALELLCLLVENGGHLLEKDRLMETLWADAFVEEGNLADNISKIRHALGDSRKEPKFIETVSGRGYRFVADVKKIEAETAPAELVSVEERSDAAEEGNATFFQSSVADYYSLHEIGKETPEPQQQPIVDSTPKHHTKRLFPLKTGFRMHRGRIIAMIAAVVGVGSLLVYLWYTFQPRQATQTTAARSIAVLPFKPLAANDRDESLELGISDSLISGFSRLRQITVRPVSAVRRYTDLDQDAAKAGRELGVESVLEGNIQQSADRIRVSARLVRVADGTTLWSETFDEKFTDIFAVQDSISQKIIGALALQLSGDERSDLLKKYTANTEAYRLYLKGRFYWNKTTPDDLQKSLDFYSQAIEIDPGYALAYAGLADSYNLLGSYGFWPLKDSHPKARAAAEKALEIDPDLAEAHASLATVIADHYWDWAAAESHFKRAIELNPNYAVAHYWYSQHLSRMGHLDQAVEEARRAQVLDPLSSSADAHVGLALYRARRMDEAAAELQKALRFNPKALDAHIFLGFVYVHQKKGDLAIDEFRTVVEISDQNPSMLALLAYGYASAGKRTEAKAILKEFGSQPGKQPVSQFEMAMIYIALGDDDRAFEWLEKAYAERAWQLGFLKVEPIFDPIRSDPRFTDLMRRVNLTP